MGFFLLFFFTLFFFFFFLKYGKGNIIFHDGRKTTIFFLIFFFFFCQNMETETSSSTMEGNQPLLFESFFNSISLPKLTYHWHFMLLSALGFQLMIGVSRFISPIL